VKLGFATHLRFGFRGDASCEQSSAFWIAFFSIFLFCFAHGRGISIAAFSDDIAVVRFAAQQAREGGLFEAAFSKLFEPLSVSGTMWRPLPVMSFALDALLHSDEVSRWRITNLALHFLGAVATGLTVRGFGSSASSAALAFGIFLLQPWAPEVSLWIVGRFDGFATLFIVATLACVIRSNGGDLWAVSSLILAVLAYASKESSATLPALIAALLWIRDCRSSRTWFAWPNTSSWRLVLVHGVVFIAYMLWRRWMFQSVSLDLYSTGASARGLSSWASAWVSHLLSVKDYFSLALLASWTACVVFACLILLALRRRENTHGLTAGIAIVAIVAAALATVFPSPNAGSDGARIYHLMAAGFAFAIGIALGARATRVRLALSFIALTSLAVWQRAAVEEWRVASNQMLRLQAEIPKLGETLAPHDYALLVVADRIGRVPFARNANGALLLEYSADRERISQMIISTDLGVWEWWTLGADGAVRKHLTKRVDAPAAPTKFYCFDGKTLQSLGYWQSNTQPDWDARWRRALARACPNLHYGR
jgi:hypothetical protein